MRVKEESVKANLISNMEKTKTMASGPITSWQTEGGKVQTVAYFMFLGSNITLNSGCSHEIKMITPWKKSNDKPRQRIKMY